MGLTRLILLILLAALLYRLWKRWRPRPTAASRPAATKNDGHMLACAHCGVFIPERDALHDGNEVYCCAEHQRVHRRV